MNESKFYPEFDTLSALQVAAKTAGRQCVVGDSNNPRIEKEKLSEFQWVGLDNLAILLENRNPGDNVIYEIVRSGLSLV